MLKPLRSHRVWRESIQVFMVMCMVIVSERLGVAMEDGEAWVLARARAADTRGSVNISMLCAFKHWGWYCVRFSISASDRSKTRGAHQAFLQLPAGKYSVGQIRSQSCAGAMWHRCVLTAFLHNACCSFILLGIFWQQKFFQKLIFYSVWV